MTKSRMLYHLDSKKSNMRLGIIIVLLFATTLIPLTVSEVSAKCIDRDNCPRPLGSAPLKEQLEQYDMVYDIKCVKIEHWLVERPNGKLACVTDSTAEKLGWYNHSYSMADSKENIVVTSGTARLVPFEIFGATLDDLSYQNNTLVATITSNAEYGVLSFLIQDELIHLNPEQCYVRNDGVPTTSYITSVNGEETKVGTSTNYSGERVVNIHTTQNAKTIEIIGFCTESFWDRR